jgi:hypothetical protein
LGLDVALEAPARLEAEEPLMPMQSTRTLLGVLGRDLPRYAAALWLPGGDPFALCNRNEQLEPAPAGRQGFRCRWQWTSDLHAPKVLPPLGRHLLARALRRYPILSAQMPRGAVHGSTISFVIGHRGAARVPHLLATIATIAAQREANVECIVVEQDVQPHVASLLPAWVRYVHAVPPSADMPYCRSWGFNVGCRQAAGDIFVLHDNDILVPADYAIRSPDQVAQGWDVVNLKRFIFFLSEEHTREHLAGRAPLESRAPSSIMENAEGGGSIAITRRAFDAIGGMDESFVGWGGEDNEFWERALTQRVWHYGSLPFVHLWHPAQTGKHHGHNPTLQRHRELAATAAHDRIAALRRRPSGQPHGPAGWGPA